MLKLWSKADDAAKTTSKSTNILERVANSKAWQVVNKVKNSKAWQVVSKLTEWTWQFLFWPFWDAGRVIGKSVNAAFKSTWVWKWVAKWITEIMAWTLDHGGNFLSKPGSNSETFTDYKPNYLVKSSSYSYKGSVGSENMKTYLVLWLWFCRLNSTNTNITSMAIKQKYGTDILKSILWL